MITEKNIDTLYDMIETLTLMSIVLADGNVSDNSCQSMAWLSGSIKERLRETLIIMESVQHAQLVGCGDEIVPFLETARPA